MLPPSLDDLTDAEIFDRLDVAYLAHELENDPKWKIIFDWLRKERTQAQHKITTVDASKTSEVVRLQETIRICNHLAEKIFVGIKKDGEMALFEAQDRELIPESPSDVTKQETQTSAT